MAKKYLAVNDDGITTEVEATAVSSGASDADKIIALNTDGEVDYSMLPAGLGVEDINVNVAYALPIATKNKWILTLLSDTAINFDMTGVPANVESASIIVVIKQDSTGPFVPTFQTGVIWPGGVEPTWSTRPGAKDVVELFTVDGGATWFGTITGVNYVGIVRGTVAMIANATAQLVGGFLRTAADYESASATIQAISSIIRTFISYNTVTASVVSISNVLYTGTCSILSSATISAVGSFEATAETSITVISTIDAASELFVGGSADAATTATLSGIAEVYLFVEGAVAMTADAASAPAGAIVTSGATAMAANATVTPVGSLPPQFTIDLTDSIYIGDGDAAPPYEAFFAGEGMVFTMSGGTAPYNIKITINEYYKDVGGTPVSGCTGTGLTYSYINNIFDIYSGCSFELSGQSTLDTSTSRVYDSGNGYGVWVYSCTLEMTDANSNVATTDFISRFANIY